MPDFYLRLSVTVKAATLGVGLLLICAAMTFPRCLRNDQGYSYWIFLILTAPVAAHMIGRAAYIQRVKTWKGTTLNDLEKEGKLDCRKKIFKKSTYGFS
jgi:multicomponent Na+:H+ antiporter subunit G